MNNEIIIAGNISTNAQLRMFMGELNEFLRNHKGRKVIVKFMVSPKDESAALRAYYYRYVIPTLRIAEWNTGTRRTDEDTEEYFRSLSPVTIENIYSESEQRYISRVREINELTNEELIEHIDWLKQLAAETYNVYIEDPTISGNR